MIKTKQNNIMHLEELKKQAAAILSIPDTVVGYFANRSFALYSYEAPLNKVGVPEAVHNLASEFREIVVLCRDTGAFDRNGRNILITPEGITFVYRYWYRSPESVEGGVLESPTM